MKLKEIKKHDGVPEFGYKDAIGLLAESGGLSFGTRTCKEEIYHAVGKAIGFDYVGEIQTEAMGPSAFSDNIDKENPGIIFFLKSETKFAMARRINRVVQLLNKRLKIEKEIVVHLHENSNSVLIRFDKWYYRNAVSISALLTFIRSAANSEFEFDTLDDFVESAAIVTRTKNNAGQDTPHFKRIIESKNLENFFDGNLPILKRKNAWLYGRKTDIPYDGIVEYNVAEYDYTDISDGVSVVEDDYNEDNYVPCRCEACSGY